jgi:hypothetical protein
LHDPALLCALPEVILVVTSAEAAAAVAPPRLLSSGLTENVAGITLCSRGITEMKTLSLKLPDALDDQLESLAGRLRTSKSAVIREAISGYLNENSPPARESFAALAQDLSGCVEGPEDLSVNPGYLAGYGK